MGNEIGIPPYCSSLHLDHVLAYATCSWYIQLYLSLQYFEYKF